MALEFEAGPGIDGVDPPECKDRDKTRATVSEYVAIIGQDVAVNLEGLAVARLDKKPRQYQTDAHIHQAYMQATAGGGEADDDTTEAQREGAPRKAEKFFKPIPWHT